MKNCNGAGSQEGRTEDENQFFWLDFCLLCGLFKDTVLKIQRKIEQEEKISQKETQIVFQYIQHLSSLF